MNKPLIVLAVITMTALAVSCGTPATVSYFQDIESDSVLDVNTAAPTITLRTDDKISIIVNSRDQKLSNLFNLPYSSKIIGVSSEYNGSSYSQGISGYTVDSDGCIDFPVLGSIKVAGLTREEVARLIKYELIGRSLVNDPVVTVEFMNLRISVLGEVAHPGRFAIDHDQYTIVDAISAAGDLTIYGVRDKVKVIRTSGDEKHTYVVNLCSAEDLLNSPVYYLQQNDVVYVNPNEMRTRQSTINGNNLLSTSFWMSVASLAVTISYYFFK